MGVVNFRVEDSLHTAFAEAARRVERSTSQQLRVLMRSFVDEAEPADQASSQASSTSSPDPVKAVRLQRAQAKLEEQDEKEAWINDLRDKFVPMLEAGTLPPEIRGEIGMKAWDKKVHERALNAAIQVVAKKQMDAAKERDVKLKQVPRPEKKLDPVPLTEEQEEVLSDWYSDRDEAEETQK